MKHPMQPVVLDDRGKARFQANAILQYLVDEGGIDMNDLAMLNFPAADRMQFAQLIGYSIDGYAELPYVSDESFAEATRARLMRPKEPVASGNVAQIRLQILREAEEHYAAMLRLQHATDAEQLLLRQRLREIEDMRADLNLDQATAELLKDIKTPGS